MPAHTYDDEGRLRRRVDRPASARRVLHPLALILAAAAATDACAGGDNAPFVERTDSALRQRLLHPPPDEYADASSWTATVPAIHRLALAPDGAIWVERWVGVR